MKNGLLVGVVWLALAAAALAIVYAAGSAMVWLIQQAIGLVWPVVAERPPVAAVVILSLVVLLGAIDRQERPRRRL